MLHSVWEASQRGEDISVRETVTTFVRNSLCGMLLGTAHLDIENISIQFTKETLITLLDETISVAGEVTLSDLTPGLKWLDFCGREEKMKDLLGRFKAYFQEILDDRSHRVNKDEPEALVDVLLSLDEDEKLSNEAIMGILLVCTPVGPHSLVYCVISSIWVGFLCFFHIYVKHYATVIPYILSITLYANRSSVSLCLWMLFAGYFDRRRISN